MKSTKQEIQVIKTRLKYSTKANTKPKIKQQAREFISNNPTY